MRRFAALALLVSLAGCTDGPDDFDLLADDNREALTVVLEGSELDAFLLAAEPHEAPAPFVRVGLVWDAPEATDLELSTSVDGVTWSDWQTATVHDVEAEEAFSFVGEVMVAGDLAAWYRVRASGGGQPTFLVMQFIESPLAVSLEGGTPVETDETDETTEVPTTDGVTSRSFALSYGNASVHARSSWGARPPRCRSYHTPNRITIHHTVTPTNDSMSPQARLRQIQAYHQNVQGWCDIGYHFLVSRDGRLWEGRPAGNLGAHVANNNTGNLGISFMGTYTGTRATSTQIDAAAALVKGLGSRFGIPAKSTRVKGHRAYGGTSCPGDALNAQIGTILSRAQGSPPPPPSSSTPAGGTTVKGIIYRGNDTRRRIAGAMVHVNMQTTVTDANGYYEVKGVPAGDAQIYASASGYVREKIRRTVSGSVTWGSIGLSPVSAGTASLQGVIYRGSNATNRVPYARVTLSNGRTATADGNGFYKITGLPAGSIKVSASKAGVGSGSVTRTLVSGRIVWGSVSL